LYGLVWSTQPGILPSNGSVLEIPTIFDVRSVAIAEFEELMPCQRDRSRCADTGIPLGCGGVQNPIETRATAEPKITVE
jgi:hypothetical protein